MALLYSLLNAEPAPLPQRLKINGVTRTDSSSFTAEELNQAGYTGPFQKPSCDPATQIVVWQGTGYAVLDLADSEIEKRRLDALKAGANYRGFWGALLSSPLYQTLRTAAAADLGANMLVTELIAALSDAKLGEPNEEIIGSAMTELLEALALPSDEIESLYFALKANGLYELYPIPGFVEPEPPAPEPSPEPAPEPEPPVVITEPVDESAPEEEEEETITFDSGTTSGGISDGATSAGVIFSGDILGSTGEDTVVFDED
tara:strand:+ start:1927 stop:2706 length:780 start_codon:yes stop_codon:yes gene_type:complete